jgi:outer membrane lipoprotein-sorting protein
MTGSPDRIRRVSCAAIACVAIGMLLPAARLRAADDVLQKARDLYAGLQSYGDTGTVVVEYGTASRDQHTFTTAISRAPRGFYFDFHKQGGDRYVIWGDPDAYHTWWKTTGVTEDYPNPNNIGAFGTAGAQTAGAAMKIPTLWYAKANLQGPFLNLESPVLDGTESVDGHACYRLKGTTGDVYGATGRKVNVRALTVWIDTGSLLIRRIVEVPANVLPGHIDRTTTTYRPEANPPIDAGRFRFTPPARP